MYFAVLAFMGLMCLLSSPAQGEAAVKSTLSATGVAQGSAVQWLVADQAAGPFEPMTGVTGPSCVIPASLTGKWVEARIAPAKPDGQPEASVITRPVEIQDRPGNPNTTFMQRTGWGLSFTFDREYIQRCAANDSERIGKDAIGHDETWDQTLSTFDVNAFANEVQSSGASFVLLALGQNSGYYCAPNATLEGYIGCKPGTYCSRRDLPMEIMKALAPMGIRVMLYLPGNPPVHNRVVRDAVHYAGRGDDSPSQITCAIWDKVIEEWSLRYGPLLSGWWMDGMYDHSAYDMKLACNWHTRAAAMKAGNPGCAISFGGCRPVGSPYEDFYNGETLPFGSIPRDGQWKIEDQATKQLAPAKRLGSAGAWLDSQYRMQWISYATVGKPDGGWGAWGNKGCARDPKSMDAWMREVFAQGGVVMLDGKVSRLGHIDPEQLKLYLETPACHMRK